MEQFAQTVDATKGMSAITVVQTALLSQEKNQMQKTTDKEESI